ncbi:ribosomal protein S18 acetylase RimI-like enzyme [Paenibacillus taihuensis]|uniref:Ribosomal protein S18 acetylase RimI-like enzyme n=1 Tax=Paenibacillus taihuensis TaxID=1156355 RepID=A0A3D9QVP0_9BACL|nr:GNAT family N-acetyltransferase [Paenibacillus taihuensis]REE68741.1 ribosomal protein S18 acetylase RimI-like enzyme [Paenibacillus taihuensis]
MRALVEIRQMIESDIQLVFDGLSGHDVSKPLDYIERCSRENLSSERTTFVALYNEQFVGWGHLVYRPEYAFFLENGIPEIQNLDVIPTYRKRGIGSQLIDAIEKFAFETYDVIGIGFGLYADYGTAQRLYIKRGYIPDGRGGMYNNLPVVPGGHVRADDDLALFLTKEKLQQGHASREDSMRNVVKDIVLGIPVTKSGDFEKYEKAIDWYEKVLGFNLIWKMGIASLKLANGQEILLFGEEEDENSIRFTGDIKRNPHYSIQFATDNIEQLQADLIRSGVTVGDIQDIGGPDRVMMFNDPYGNRFWACQEK